MTRDFRQMEYRPGKSRNVKLTGRSASLSACFLVLTIFLTLQPLLVVDMVVQNDKKDGILYIGCTVKSQTSNYLYSYTNCMKISDCKNTNFVKRMYKANFVTINGANFEN